MFDKAVFGQRLLEQRTKKRETQSVIAKLLGISTTQVSDMEQGKTTTSFDRLCLLCDHFKVSADYLLGRIEEP